MKLRDLDAYFSKYREEIVDPTVFVDGVLSPSGRRGYYDRVETLTAADGIWFDCPCAICGASEYGRSRHLIGFEGRCPPGTYSRGSNGQDTRWTVGPTSTCLDDLVLMPSIQRVGGCNWHGFVGYSGVPPGEAA